ncbi:MAG TPA: hypothetical protein VM364_04105 [Vicinamibacterales bacterium]|nr:hypothetical protein [Vicinamibacterales bacterium]
MRPDLIAHVERRVRRVHAVEALGAAATAWAVLATALLLAGAPRWAAAGAGALAAFGVGAAAWIRRSGARGTRAAAAAIERARPSNNLIVTAEEIQRRGAGASEWIRERVLADAVRAVHGVTSRDVVPLRAAATVAAVALVSCAIAGMTLLRESRARDILEAVRSALPDAVTGADAQVVVVVEPPAYTARPAVTVRDPARIEALDGSRVTFRVSAGTPWRVRMGRGAAGLTFVVRDRGYFALEDTRSGEAVRLIPLVVTRDRVPVVRIEAPAKDLLLPDGDRTLPLVVSAIDDLALAALDLRFTKISGAGEQFEFEEGGVPVSVAAASEREWRGSAHLPLASLRLGPGDSLVYRAVARDRRPGAEGTASSDTYFVEIAGPGQVPLEGVELPPEMERYAMSQQMIVMRIERLRTREASLPRDAVAEEAASIAAEQRTVRANFIFLLGGHVEDEEEEAEHSHEIQEGRLENTARRDINAAIGYMTRAEQGLAAVNIGAALAPARQAVDALQRAFGRSRYLLRALASRSRLDPSRRLTGDLRTAADWRRAAPDPEPRPGDAVRELLAQLLAVRTERAATGAELERLAEMALAIDPVSAAWQDVSQRLLVVRNLSASESPGALDRVIAAVAKQAQAGTLPRTAAATPSSRVRRAWQMEHAR